MKITDFIADSIDRLPKRYEFTYADFMCEVKSKKAVNKALNRMVFAGRMTNIVWEVRVE